MAIVTKDTSTQQVADEPHEPQVLKEPKRTFDQAQWSKRPRRGMTNDALLSSSLEALRGNALRSFLTMLGVIIGVSAVISVVSLTQGVNLSVTQRFASLGTNVITIAPGASSSGSGARSSAGSAQTLTMADTQAVTQVAHVVNVTPVITVTGQAVYGNQNWNTSIRGAYPNYQTIQNWQLASGSWFSDTDEQTGTAVAVLGQTVVQNLFSGTNTNPIGQTMRVNDQLFRIIGTLQTKGSQGFSNADDVILVPFSAANARLKPSPIYVNQIQVQVDNAANVVQAQQDITALLRQRHNLRGPDPSLSQQNKGSGGSNLLGGLGGGGRGQGGGGRGQGGGGSNTISKNGTTTSTSRSGASVPNDFQVLNANQFVQTAQQSTSELTVLLIGIAAISLSVGGIGIMNIMLVSVTERTREIGIRMAIGARQKDIRNQFLLEALLLSVGGGMIGILIGLVGGFELTTSLGFPFAFSLGAVVLAFTVSAIVGIGFGLYPAVRAAKLAPVVTLRME